MHGEGWDKLIGSLVTAQVPLHDAEAAFRERLITLTLRETGGNQSVTARRLGIHRNTLTRLRPTKPVCSATRQNHCRAVGPEGHICNRRDGHHDDHACAHNTRWANKERAYV